ncbi:Glutamate-1-semialdehyde aminotransferase [Micromonospora inyonensis]|uniref:Glutamate-1-semialdehyde aminotransferase n=2 Tax=Micromonospora inyonensis TaxID=47866 RepID=A0A1C6RLY2_9ACTN|nr:Glutamate-1-semialdehyde aminotransferase [Micromonospora inyonensis]
MAERRPQPLVFDPALSLGWEGSPIDGLSCLLRCVEAVLRARGLTRLEVARALALPVDLAGRRRQPGRFRSGWLAWRNAVDGRTHWDEFRRLVRSGQPVLLMPDRYYWPGDEFEGRRHFLDHMVLAVGLNDTRLVVLDTDAPPADDYRRPLAVTPELMRGACRFATIHFASPRDTAETLRETLLAPGADWLSADMPAVSGFAESWRKQGLTGPLARGLHVVALGEIQPNLYLTSVAVAEEFPDVTAAAGRAAAGARHLGRLLLAAHRYAGDRPDDRSVYEPAIDSFLRLRTALDEYTDVVHHRLGRYRTQRPGDPEALWKRVARTSRWCFAEDVAAPTSDTNAGGLPMISLSPPLALTRSQELLARAARVDATMAYSGYVLPRDQMVPGEYPMYGERAQGSYIWDVDGNRYLDLFLAGGTIILGHVDPVVSEAVVREIRDGFAITLRKKVQVELAELLTDVVPYAERVFLLKSGSDATSAAVRLSRAHTGRERVIRWGYNGWHDWCANRPNGVPESARQSVSTFDFNDLDSLRLEFDRYPGEVACLLMMPFEEVPPALGFLEGAADLARENGALFVLDEMRSGFRVALGGAQERYGVRADLVTFSKAMANGYPISALVGREEVMRTVVNVHIGSTFHINGAEMAAAVATIGRLRDTSVLKDVETLGTMLQRGLAEQIAAGAVEAHVLGVPQMPFMRFHHADERLRQLAQDAFYTETIRRGILLHPNHHWYISGTTTADDIAALLDATAAGFMAAEAAVSRG